jgi:hypothetical protein
MLEKLIILLNSFFIITFFMACQTTYPTESKNTEDLKKEISDLRTQMAKDEYKNQQEIERTKKANVLLAESLKNEIQKSKSLSRHINHQYF